MFPKNKAFSIHESKKKDNQTHIIVFLQMKRMSSNSLFDCTFSPTDFQCLHCVFSFHASLSNIIFILQYCLICFIKQHLCPELALSKTICDTPGSSIPSTSIRICTIILVTAPTSSKLKKGHLFCQVDCSFELVLFILVTKVVFNMLNCRTSQALFDISKLENPTNSLKYNLRRRSTVGIKLTAVNSFDHNDVIYKATVQLFIKKKLKYLK